MKRRTQGKLNNAGYSLVEVIVALAIVVIAATAIFEFALVASKQYQKETLEAEVQYEAQLVMNQLQELLIDASEGVSYAYTASGGTDSLILSDAEIAAGVTVKDKYLTVYNDDKYCVLKWVSGEQKLFYSEYRKDGTGSFTQSADEELMAELVQAFTVDLTQLEKSHSVRLDVTFSNQREYRVMQNVTLRNRVVVNKPISEVYAE